MKTSLSVPANNGFSRPLSTQVRPRGPTAAAVGVGSVDGTVRTTLAEASPGSRTVACIFPAEAPDLQLVIMQPRDPDTADRLAALSV